jgi:pilus assembly protein CpaE
MMLLRVVVMDTDAASRRQLLLRLQQMDRLVVVAEVQNPADANAAAKEGADVAIIEVPEGAAETQALDCIAHILRLAPGISVIASGSDGSADLVIRAIRAGAVEFLRRPISPDDLAAAIEKVRRIRRGASTPVETVGRVLSVYATKGGLGVTALATNLATCLVQRAPDNVVIVDLDLRQGGVSTLLNLEPAYSTTDAFGQIERLDETFLRGLLVRHASGLDVLAAPIAIERSRLGPDQIRDGLEVIRSYFAYVILDLPHDLDPGTIAALEESDEILYLVGLSVPAVRTASAGLHAFRHLGIDDRKVKVVVSRADAQEEVSLRQAREVLGRPIFWRIPNDYPTVLSSSNAGTPFVLSSPRTQIAKSLRHLSENLSRVASATRQGNKGEAASLIRRVLPFMP